MASGGGRLVLFLSRQHHLYKLVGLVCILTAYIVSLFSVEEYGVWTWLGLLGILIFAPGGLHSLRILRDNTWTFQQSSPLVRQGSGRHARYHSITGVELRVVHQTEVADSFQVRLLCRKGLPLVVEQFESEPEALALAKKVAGHIKVPFSEQ